MKRRKRVLRGPEIYIRDSLLCTLKQEKRRRDRPISKLSPPILTSVRLNGGKEVGRCGKW